MNDSILSLWHIMAQEQTVGLVKRLFLVDAPIKIFGVYKYPEKIYGVAFSFTKDVKINLDSFRNLKELSIQLVQDTTYKTNKLLLVQLFSLENLDVFACLCDNLIGVVRKCGTSSEAIKEIINQIEKWKAMFDRKLSDGLTLFEQQGLYGELIYLQKLIDRNLFSKVESLKLWSGTDKSVRDFQGKEWAVEVKTISVNNSDQITINGERQLDETLLKMLFLYHLSVESSRSSGQTLNDIVEELRKALMDDMVALNLFNFKLMEAGYFDNHRHLYSPRCYKIRKENIYHVHDAFPRIKENELRNGVSNVTYSINVSTCTGYLVNENEHFNCIESL